MKRHTSLAALAVCTLLHMTAFAADPSSTAPIRIGVIGPVTGKASEDMG